MARDLRIGIDLGTTFSCVAALDERGAPVLVPSASGDATTPSVVWFDGHEAIVGAHAYDREAERPGSLATFVKRQMGRPATIPPKLYDRDDAPTTAPYLRDGYAWGVEGIQALLLRQLRADALAHFRRVGTLDTDDDEVRLGAVVTVPAYFGDIEREQTRRAAEVAGLHVLGIINEPAAAALAYRLVSHGSKRVFVFDLGGGTFDVTLIDLAADGHAEVLASAGNPELGGKDWDDLLYRHFRDEIIFETGDDPDEADELALRRKATETKIALSDRDHVEVEIPLPTGRTHRVEVRRRPPPGYDPILSLDDTAFYFEMKSTDLLTQVRALCKRALDAARLPASKESEQWKYVDEVVMVGGSCRMPMVPALLEEMSGGHHEVRRRPEGFDFDTAVAIGAALYALDPARVRDVSSATYGIKVRRRSDDRSVVQPLIHKNARLPAAAERTFRAGANAMLELYQGDSEVVSECVRRGQIALRNPEGSVRVVLHMDGEGTLSVACELPDGEHRTVTIWNEWFDERTAELAERVRAVTLVQPDGADDGPSDDTEDAGTAPGVLDRLRGVGRTVRDSTGSAASRAAGLATRAGDAAGRAADLAAGAADAAGRATSAASRAVDAVSDAADRVSASLAERAPTRADLDQIRGQLSELGARIEQPANKLSDVVRALARGDGDRPSDP